MIYASLFSGIEAASAAWEPRGWRAAFFSEVDPFASEVLRARFPSVVNVGDVRSVAGNAERLRAEHGPIDVVVGGSPCQGFSVAGLRKGLADPRSNLALAYLAAVDALRPRWVVWENVPGVLSTNGGRDFGAFLRALGELGYGFAYRVLDAQHFGVPQRRHRVFVVGHLGDWRRAAAVLFEPESLRRDPPKGRAKREDAAAHAEGGARGGGGYEQTFVAAPVGSTEFLSQSSRVYDAAGLAPTLQASGKRDGNRAPIIFDETQITSPLNRSNPKPGDPAHPLAAGARPPTIASSYVVRRLTPVECERLMGLPDSWTDIPWRGKPGAPDSLRYKALGNSMAVPVMRWIGERIAMVDAWLDKPLDTPDEKTYNAQSQEGTMEYEEGRVVRATPGMTVLDLDGDLANGTPPNGTPTAKVGTPSVAPPIAAVAAIPPIAKLTSNVKGGVAVELALCTAVVGENTSGKTAILDAVRLALTGRHPVGSDGVDLLSLCPEGEALFAGVELAGAAGFASLAVEGTRKRAKRPVHKREGALASIDLANVIPTDALGSLLDLGTTKAREAIFARFGAATGDVETPPVGLSAPQSALWSEVARTTTGDAAARLAAMSDEFRKRKLAAGREAKAVEAEVDAKAAALGGQGAPDEAEVGGAEVKVELARKAQAARDAHAGLVRQRARLEEEIEAFKEAAAALPPIPPEVVEAVVVEPPSLGALRAAVAEAEREVAAAQATAASDDALIDAIEKLLAASVKIGCCALCESKAPIGAGPLLDALRKRRNDRAAALEKARARLAQVEKAVADEHIRRVQANASIAEAATATRNRIVARHDAFREEARVLRARREELDRAITSAGEAGEEIDLGAATAALGALRLRVADAATLSEAKAKLRAAQDVQRAAKTLETEAAERMDGLLASVKANAEAAVNRYMPAGFRAVLTLDGDCRWEVVGRDGTPHGRGVASGSEWSSLAVALACAWTEGSPMRVLLLDDSVIGPLDGATFPAFLTMVKQRVTSGDLTQAIVATYRESEVPVDWTVVHMKG